MHHRSAALALVLVLATVATSSALSTQRAQAVDIPSPGAVVIPSARPRLRHQCTTVIVGTAQDDQPHGTPGTTSSSASAATTPSLPAGQDTILGGEGDDLLAGGPGDDCILGGPGDDESLLWLYTRPNGNDDSHSVTFRYEY